MISVEDIKKLAKLARLEVPEGELAKLTKDIDSILGYVDQLSKVEVSVDRSANKPELRNVMRLDEVPHEPKEFTEKILNDAPKRKGDYLSVKKIL